MKNFLKQLFPRDTLMIITLWTETKSISILLQFCSLFYSLGNRMNVNFFYLCYALIKCHFQKSTRSYYFPLYQFKIKLHWLNNFTNLLVCFCKMRVTSTLGMYIGRISRRQTLSWLRRRDEMTPKEIASAISRTHTLMMVGYGPVDFENCMLLKST